MQDLFDIKEAAAFLRVSETSLRRWTNDGRLRCVRIGGRRERRFRREDLERFLASGPVAAAAGTHVCGFYTSPLNRARDAAAFLAAAWVPDARFFLAAARDVQADVVRLLEGAVRQELVVAEYEGSPGAQLEQWHTHVDAARRAGFSRVVVVGDVSGGALGKLSIAELLEYETAFQGSIVARFPVTTLCQYDARMLSGLDAAHVLREHHGTVTTYHSQR
jgi:transcriptional repressor of dcmA and dcmR